MAGFSSGLAAGDLRWGIGAWYCSLPRGDVRGGLATFFWSLLGCFVEDIGFCGEVTFVGDDDFDVAAGAFWGDAAGL